MDDKYDDTNYVADDYVGDGEIKPAAKEAARRREEYMHQMLDMVNRAKREAARAGVYGEMKKYRLDRLEQEILRSL